MAPGSRPRLSTATSTPIENAAPLSFPLSTHTPSSNVASTSKIRRVRGVTKGKGIEKIVARLGKLPVAVSEQFIVPVGINAPSLANEIGKEIRASAPLQGVVSWMEIDKSIKAAIIQRTRDKYDIEGYDDNEKVRKSIDDSCARRYRGWKCVLHTHYKILLKDGKDPKTHPCVNVTKEDWIYIVDNVWTKETFMARSKQGENARAKLPYNHVCGSRSFSTVMSLMERFEEVLNRCSQPYLAPITQEEISIKVLGPRKGYLRGYGTGPKPTSSRNTTHFGVHVAEVDNLKNVILMLKGLNDTQQHQLQEQNQLIEVQTKKFDDFQTFTMQMFQSAGIFPRDLGGAAGDDHAMT